MEVEGAYNFGRLNRMGKESRNVPQLDRAGDPSARPSDSQPGASHYELSNRTCPALALSSLRARADAGGVK